MYIASPGILYDDATPDRTEFIRDAQASLRLGPLESGAYFAEHFVSNLCRVQARKEVYADNSLTQYQKDQMEGVRFQELVRLCHDLGYPTFYK